MEEKESNLQEEELRSNGTRTKEMFLGVGLAGLERVIEESMEESEIRAREEEKGKK